MYKIFSSEALSASALIELCTAAGLEEGKKGIVPAKLSYILWSYATWHMEHGKKDIHFNEFKEIYLEQAIEIAKVFKWNNPNFLVHNYDPSLKLRSNFNLYALYWWTHSVVTNFVPVEHAIEIIATLIGSFTTIKDDESSSEVRLAWIVLTVFWFQFFHYLVIKLKYNKYHEALTTAEKVLRSLKHTGKLAIYTGLTISTKEVANKALSEEEFSVSSFFRVMWSNAGGQIALFGMLVWLIGDSGERVASLCKKVLRYYRPGLNNPNNQILLGNKSIQQ